MNDKLLLKCDNTIYADEVVRLLNKHGIVTRQHDENQDPRTGSYGPLPGIAIYVFEKDYDKACSLVEPLQEQRNDYAPSCPKCGSDAVEPLVHRHNYGNSLNIISIILICIPVIYICMPGVYGLRSPVADMITLLMVIVGFIVVVAGRHSNDNYQCTDCGKKFRHQ